MPNQIRKDTAPLKAAIAPGAIGTDTSISSPWLNVANFQRVQTVVLGGLLDGAEVALSFEQATTDDAPEGAELKALSAWTGGTLALDNKTLQVDNDPALLDINAGFRFVRAVLTADDGGGDPFAALAMLGLEPKDADPAAPEAVDVTAAAVLGG